MSAYRKIYLHFARNKQSALNIIIECCIQRLEIPRIPNDGVNRVYDGTVTTVSDGHGILQESH